jgi:hypothetical protein
MSLSEGENGITLKSAMDFDMTSFDPLRVGMGKFEFKHTNIRIKF